MDDLISCIKEHEGLRLICYKDTLGFWTIGFGRNLSGKGISNAEALYMLNNDINECKVLLSHYDWFNALDKVRQEVLIELCFNIGLGSLLKFVHMIEYLKQHDYKNAASDMLNSLWARQVGELRSENMAKRLLTGSYAD